MENSEEEIKGKGEKSGVEKERGGLKGTQLIKMFSFIDYQVRGGKAIRENNSILIHFIPY